MSRSTPPETLSKDEVRQLAAVRRDIWTSAFYGMGVGSASAIVLHTVAQLGNKRFWTLPLSRNTAFASFMLGGAFGSFLMATTTGKNEVHNLHDIFQAGARQPGETYKQSLERAKERAERLNTLERRHSNRQMKDFDPEEQERLERERNRLYRRATLSQTMKTHGGLSDSHGGHWVKKEDAGSKKH